MRWLFLIAIALLPATLASADVRLTHEVLEFAGKRWLLIVSTRTNGENVVYQQLVPLDSQPTGEIPPPELHSAPAVRSPRSGLSPILTDIDSRMPPGHIYTAEDPWTWGHETTHGINNRLRNAYQAAGLAAWRVNAFYVVGGQVAYCYEPVTTIGNVAPLVPPSLRGMRYQLYLVSQRRDWDDRPLYLLDEWSAYINGAKVFLETPERIRDGWIVTPGAVEFAVYATCVAWAARSEDVQLKRLLAYQWREAIALHERDRRPESHATLSRLQTSPDAEEFRRFCEGYFGREWFQANLLRPLPAVERVLAGGKHWLPTPYRPEQSETERLVRQDMRYPVRGAWWSFPGSGKADLVRHLQSGEHAGLFDPSWLNSLTYSELMSAHSDHHEGRVQWQYVRRPTAVRRTAMRFAPERAAAACPT